MHEIHDLIIQGIANLLLANPLSGTQPCLDLATGDHANEDTRYIACVLFTQVLQSGTQLGAASTAAPSAYKNSLCEVLIVLSTLIVCSLWISFLDPQT
jgi:hypothetical protein